MILHKCLSIKFGQEKLIKYFLNVYLYTFLTNFKYFISLAMSCFAKFFTFKNKYFKNKKKFKV